MLEIGSRCTRATAEMALIDPTTLQWSRSCQTREPPSQTCKLTYRRRAEPVVWVITLVQHTRLEEYALQRYQSMLQTRIGASFEGRKTRGKNGCSIDTHGSCSYCVEVSISYKFAMFSGFLFHYKQVKKNTGRGGTPISCHICHMYSSSITFRFHVCTTISSLD